METTINLALGPSDRLLPCPFCGSTELELENTWTATYWIRCEGCTAEVHGEPFGGRNGAGHRRVTAHERAKASAIAKWNSREASR